MAIDFNIFVSGITANSAKMNENFADINTLLFATGLDNSNIAAGAAIEQAKINNTTADVEIIAKAVADRSKMVDMYALIHNDPYVGNSVGENMVVGLDGNGILPLPVLRNIWETGGDSNLLANTNYKISAGLNHFSSYSCVINTGFSIQLVTIVAMISGVAGFTYVTSIALPNVGLTTSTESGQIRWLAIGR